MDLTWFDPTEPFAPRLDDLFGRVVPLVANVGGRRGVLFNLGWLVDLVTEWTGDPEQKIPTRSRRTAQWAAVGYRRLHEFVGEFHAAAQRHGLDDLRCGVLFVEWAHVVWPPELKIYDFDSDWYERHPELYEAPRSFINMPDLHPVNRLRADTYPYASAPGGIAEGTTFGELFGPQWASFAEYTGFDSVLLRDGFCGPMIYTRNGPYGGRAPADPAVVERFSDAVRALFRDVKQAAPDRLLLGYSSAISPVADWRVGCVDFEALIADGYLDGWIEQTWGGAWQDWWHQLWKGWTFQAANLTTRAAMIARANERREQPCALYHLVETWDGWEHWDTLHQVPGKLTWGAWAFAHAGALTPDGPRPSDGAYVSWLNNGDMELLSDDDVTFVAGILDRAETSAATLENVYGPVLVYHRQSMARLATTSPDDQVGEWIDDQAGLLMKWGVPILAATRTEWLGAIDGDRQLISQPPMVEGDGAALLDHADVAVVGRADVIAAAVADRLGLTPDDRRMPSDFYVCTGPDPDVPPADRPYLPDHVAVGVGDDVDVLYSSRHTPLLTSRDGWCWWQPTDWSEPFNQFLPKYQLGSTYPAYRFARLLGDLAGRRGRSHLDRLHRSAPVAFHLWRSGDAVHVLLGNLETGELGDSRVSRDITVRLSRRELALADGQLRLVRVDGSGREVIVLAASEDPGFVECAVTLDPESCVVYRVEEGAHP